MSKNKDNHLHNKGMFGGMAVKHMIEEVEDKMAQGMHVSAKPSSAEEEKELEHARAENKKSENNKTQ